MKILIPIDGSPLSEAAVEFVAGRSTLIGTSPEISLVNVQLPISAQAERIIGRAATRGIYQERTDKIAKRPLAQLKAAGLDARVVVAVGSPGDAIAQEAGRHGADLIVMGSHGRSEFKRVLLGSVAYAVLMKTHVPVLLLRGKAAPKRESLRVVIALDGSRLGLEAVKYALRHREMFGAEPAFTLIHVASDFVMPLAGDMTGATATVYTPEQIDAMRDAAYEAAFEPARKLMRRAQVPFSEARLIGIAGDEIAAFARKSADLTLLGSHGYGALKAAVLGSVAMRVAASGNTPLLIVRPRRARR
ncbi:MAG: universal stress protein [Gemmatimonadota bacterium]